MLDGTITECIETIDVLDCWLQARFSTWIAGIFTQVELELWALLNENFTCKNKLEECLQTSNLSK
jgi:hypothetical protein